MKLSELFENNTPEIIIDEGPHDPDIFKAIILVGSPGSGKSYVVNEIVKGTGLKIVNSDIFYEYLAKKNDKSLLEPSYSDEHKNLGKKSWDLKQKQLAQYVSGGLGIVLDGTGRIYDSVVKNAQYLKSLGYDVLVVAVNTDLETSLSRNQSRERKVPVDFLKQTHKDVANNLGKFQNYFGNNMLIIDNSKDSNTDFNVVWKQIQRFLNRPNPHSGVK